jgi:cysteine desulfurase
MQIYLDHSATTPPRPEVIATMQAVLANQWGNPASIHHWGERSSLTVETARHQVAGLIACPANEANRIVFTSGGTEADNLALLGVTQTYDPPQHLIISQVEHAAIAEPARWLESQGWQVTRLAVDTWGRVDPAEFRRSIQANTVLASIIYGQSEVGTVQPISQLGAIAREAGILFHTDAVQVAGRLALDVQTLPVDLLSLSSHKLYGPQGVGALYIRPGINVLPTQAGGGQEGGLRSGTPAVAAIAGFGVAAELAQRELATESQRLQTLRDLLLAKLADVPQLIPTGDPVHRLPHHLSFCFQGTNQGTNQGSNGKTLVRQMNLAGIGISSGSACNSGTTMPSPVLQAMGYDDGLATNGVRLSLGRSTTEADVVWTAMVLRQILSRI